MSHRLLIVEDDFALRKLLALWLGRTYRVEAVSTVKEALALAERGKPFDALILDISLGEPTTGIDLIKILRGYAHLEHTPALAATALTFHTDTILEAGFDALITKPYTVELLQSRVEHLLSGQGPIADDAT
jgi:CheY-like chemotaxis protein